MILRAVALVAVLSLASIFGCATGEDTTSAEAASTGSGGAGGGACAEPLADCDGDASNGCETDTRASSLHCGSCGNECKSVGGQASCADGACSIVCELPFADCDGDPSNGCETDREISTAHCGACGYGCDVYPNQIVSCIKGTCIGLCSPGLGDCDGSLENGCETVLATNPSHCGGCNKECAAGCAAGKCQGVVLATGQASPISITADATHVYWTNAGTPPAYGDGSVRKVSKAGGAPIQLAVDRKAFGIAVDATHVYWTSFGSDGMSFSDGAVRRAALDGSGIEDLAATAQAPQFVAVDASHVYWTSAGKPPGFLDGSVMRAPLAGGAAEVLSMGQPYPLGIAIDATHVYWANGGTLANSYTDGSVMRAPLAGGAAEVLASKQALPFGIAVDATHVYWANSVQAGAVLRVGLGGGNPAVVAAGQEVPIFIALDGSKAYWTRYASGQGDGALLAAPLAGGGITSVAAAQDQPYGLAVDATNIYWLTVGTAGMNDGTVRMLAK